MTDQPSQEPTQAPVSGETATTVAASGLQRIALGSWLGMIGLLTAWLIALDPPPESLRLPLLAVFLLPLLLGVRGILRRRRYTLQWTGMLAMAYFVHGLVAATGPAPARWLGTAEALLALVYFGCAMLVLRGGKRAHRAAKAASKAAPSD